MENKILQHMINSLIKLKFSGIKSNSTYDEQGNQFPAMQWTKTQVLSFKKDMGCCSETPKGYEKSYLHLKIFRQQINWITSTSYFTHIFQNNNSTPSINHQTKVRIIKAVKGTDIMVVN